MNEKRCCSWRESRTAGRGAGTSAAGPAGRPTAAQRRDRPEQGSRHARCTRTAQSGGGCLAVVSHAERGWGRLAVRGGLGSGHWEARPRGGDGAAAPNDEERRSCQPAMVDPRRRRKREVRETMNGHGFVKRMARRCRGRRDLPHGGGGGRRNATVWPEKLAEEFVGNLVFPNFGVRSTGLRVVARESSRTFGISVSRATPAYIYIRRVWRFWKVKIFINY